MSHMMSYSGYCQAGKNGKKMGKKWKYLSTFLNQTAKGRLEDIGSYRSPILAWTFSLARFARTHGELRGEPNHLCEPCKPCERQEFGCGSAALRI